MRLDTKDKRLAARWMPKNSTPIVHPRGESVAVVYVSDETFRAGINAGKTGYFGVAYIGTAGRPTWNYSFRNPEQREQKIKEFFDGMERHAAFKAERLAQRKVETSPFSRAPKAEPIHVSTAATAKELRETLHTAFPQTRFSVRSSEYSGGSSIDVRWTDGPTHAQVDEIMDRFENCGFDGMQDLKTYRGACLYKGHRVFWGADYVHGSRSESFELLKEAAFTVAEECELPLLEIEPDGSRIKDGCQAVPWCIYKKDDGSLGFAHNSFRNESHDQLIYQYARSISRETAQPVELPRRIADAESKDESPQPGSTEYEALRLRIEELARLSPANAMVN